MYHATVRVTLRPSILDPQGKAITQALQNLGFEGIASVRTGKLMHLTVEAATRTDAEALVREACVRLLANPVMEDYEIDLVELETA